MNSEGDVKMRITALLAASAALAAMSAAPLAAADPSMNRHRDLRTPPTDGTGEEMTTISNGLGDTSGAGSHSVTSGSNDLIGTGHHPQSLRGAASAIDTVGRGHARLDT